MSSVATVSGERLYWAVLGPECRTLQPRSRLYRCERVLPMAVDDLQTAQTVLDDGRTVIVGIAADDLRRVLHEDETITPALWSLIPQAVPSCLQTLEIPDTALLRLDLLHGTFEPARRRGLRRAMMSLAAVAVVGVLSLAWWGVERRVAHWRHHGDDLRRAVVTAIEAHVPPREGEATLPAEVRLTQELRRLEGRDRRAANHQAAPVPVVATLNAMWRRWPRDLRVQVETLTVSDNRLVVRGTVAGSADAENLTKALRDMTVEGYRWRGGTPSVMKRGEDFAFVVTLAPRPYAEGTAETQP